MRYEIAKNLSDKDFKRATGVERNTFQTMVAKRWGEGPSLYKLPIETQIMKSQGAAQ